MNCQVCGAALESLPVSCPLCGSHPVLGARYEIRAIIGRGGMGEVFLAHDRTLNVAIKRLPPQLASSQELRQSLRREAHTLARLPNDNIAKLFDLAEIDGDYYLILEYVPGPTLRDMIGAGYRASLQELAKIVTEVCQGLTAAHNAGVIHRDLKPSNLLAALDGAEQTAYLSNRRLPANLANAKIKIADLGIAKAIAEAQLPMANPISGTPAYLAPDQLRGEVPWPQTDVYALGVIAHELVTGRLPSQPWQSIPGVHPAVTEVIRKAVSPVREQRFPSALRLQEAFYNAIQAPSPWPTPLVPAAPANSRAKWFIVSLAVVVVVGVILATILTKYSSVFFDAGVPAPPRVYTTAPPPPPPPPPPPLAPPPVESRPAAAIVSPVPNSRKGVPPDAIKVGGNVQAAKLIHMVTPEYPALAKAARIQGSVLFTALIGKDGSIQDLTLISGHPLLVPAASAAVKNWLYKPTLVNGEVVEVVTQIEINFKLQ